MKNYIERACEEIDASLFSSNDFYDSAERNALRDYISRWQRQMKEIEQLIFGQNGGTV